MLIPYISFDMKKILFGSSFFVVAIVLYRLLFSYVMVSSFSTFGWLDSKEFFPKYVLFNPLKERELYGIVYQCIDETKQKIMQDTIFVESVSTPNGNLNIKYATDNIEKLEFYRFFLSDSLPIKIESIKDDDGCLMILILKEWRNGECLDDAMLKYRDDNNYKWYY